MKKYIFVVAVLMVIATLLSVYYVSVVNTKFSVERWNSHIWSREKMLDDLTNTYNLYEMTYDDVINLLGTNGVVETRHEEDYYICYYVGKGFVDPVLFSISFDENGVVSKYYTVDG